MNKNFRIEFVKSKIKNRFYNNIKDDDVLNRFIIENGERHILFEFVNDEVKKIVVDTITNNLPKTCLYKVKYTSLGFKYLKIYKL